ncbi:hypothetical protein evm_006156 [Chilo suppressalis]|nr:hypothetical protein evm_006156 [Chilo suppressalis]
MIGQCIRSDCERWRSGFEILMDTLQPAAGLSYYPLHSHTRTPVARHQTLLDGVVSGFRSLQSIKACVCDARPLRVRQ